MSDAHLRSAIIKLAHANPELRGDLLPLIKSATSTVSWADVSDAVDTLRRRIELYKPVAARDALRRLQYLLVYFKGDHPKLESLRELADRDIPDFLVQLETVQRERLRISKALDGLRGYGFQGGH